MKSPMSHTDNDILSETNIVHFEKCKLTPLYVDFIKDIYWWWEVQHIISITD